MNETTADNEEWWLILYIAALLYIVFIVNAFASQKIISSGTQTLQKLNKNYISKDIRKNKVRRNQTCLNAVLLERFLHQLRKNSTDISARSAAFCISVCVDLVFVVFVSHLCSILLYLCCICVAFVMCLFILGRVATIREWVALHLSSLLLWYTLAQRRANED